MDKDVLEKAEKMIAYLRATPRWGSDCGKCTEWGCEGCDLRDLLDAAELLEQLTAPEPNEPLTLEELRGMDTGEWLWIECLEKFEYDGKVSAYYRKHNDYTRGEALCCGYPGISFGFDFHDYGISWLAYRRRPEGGGV